MVMRDIAGLCASGVLPRDAAISFLRIFGGLFLGGALGLTLGALMARSRSLDWVLHPLVSLTYPLPKIALIPFVILLFGLGEFAKIFVVSMGGFFLMLINTRHGVLQIDRTYFDIAKVCAYTRADIWRFVILPGAMPSVFNGIKLASGASVLLVVAAEFIGSSSGIGYRIWVSWETFQITHMLSALFVLSVMGWSLNAFWERAEKWAMPWRDLYY